MSRGHAVRPGAAKRAKLRKIRWHAKRREIAMHLTDEFMVQMMELPCHYCGRPPQQVAVPASRPGARVTETWLHNSIDRKDSDGDYTVDNVVPCCKYCQWAKNVKPYEVFVASRRHTHPTVTPQSPRKEWQAC